MIPRLDGLTCHCDKGPTPAIQSLTKPFLQRVTRQAETAKAGWGQWHPWHKHVLLQLHPFSGSINSTCAGPEPKLPAQKLAETEDLGIKQCQDGCTAPLLSTCFPGHCPISLQANPRLANKFTAIGCHLIGHRICESFKLVSLLQPPQVHLKTLGPATNAGG